MFHFAEGNQTRGPLPIEQLHGVIHRQTLVWREGMADWQPAGELPELASLFVEPHPTPPLATARAQASEGSHIVMTYARPDLSRSTPGLAIASMVLGILSVVMICAWPFAIPCSVLALVFGLVSRSQCKREGRPGEAMAMTGIVLSLVPIGLILFFIGFIIVMALQPSGF